MESKKNTYLGIIWEKNRFYTAKIQEDYFYPTAQIALR